MEVLGPRELMEQVRDKELCVACGACVGLCPYHKVYKGKIALVFDCDRAYGRCYAFCPQTKFNSDSLSRTMFNQPDDDAPLGNYRTITAARAGRKLNGNDADKPFQNGGTASALMMAALDKGLIDSAILTGSESTKPIPRQVKDSSDVLSCSGSKYMATPTMSLLNQSIESGEKKHGVVGTCCQMKAVASMRNNPFNKEEYKEAVSLSLGLFCTWALDYRQFEKFLNTKAVSGETLSMDVPPPPAQVFVIKTSDGEFEIPLEEIRAMIPQGCSQCTDMTARWADASVGALEGKPDWNTLIIRSEKGEAWVDMAVKQNYLELEEFPAESLAHLTEGAEIKKTRAMEIIESESKEAERMEKEIK